MYVIANIKIPIKVNDDGSTISLMNHSIIDIEQCEELPPENGNQLLMIQESVKKYMEKMSNVNPQQEAEPTATIESIVKPTKTGTKNTTFKNYSKHNAHRLTIKQR